MTFPPMAGCSTNQVYQMTKKKSWKRKEKINLVVVGGDHKKNEARSFVL